MSPTPSTAASPMPVPAPRRARRPRPPLTLRVVVLFLATALIVPVLTYAAYVYLALQVGTQGSVQTFQFQLCRRGTCLGEGGPSVGTSDLSTYGSVVVLPFVVAGVGLVLALLTRRRGWMTVPLTILHVLFALTVWNAVAYRVAGGQQVVGIILLAVVALGLPLAMLGLGELALPVHRKPRRIEDAQAGLVTGVGVGADATAWSPPPAPEPALAGLGAYAQPMPKLEPQRPRPATPAQPPAPGIAGADGQAWQPPAQQPWPPTQ